MVANHIEPGFESVVVALPTTDAPLAPTRPPEASRLLALMAHELRTPLATFEVTLEVLREDMELTTGDARQLVDRLYASSRWMADLVDSLLTLDRLERGEGQLPKTRLSARTVIESALALVQPLLTRRQQKARLLSPERDIWIMANAPLLGQVVINLVTNACLYSAPGDVIDLTLRDMAGVAVLRVTDHGPGIAPEEHQRIFEPFARGSAARQNARGLGLGLYLARMVADHHGGSVGVDSRVGHGASFWLHLPLAPLPT